MPNARALQLFLGRRLPDEVLDLIFSFGFHLWLREPWSVLARAQELPVLAIPPALYQYMDFEVERGLIERLCQDYEHDGLVRGFKVVRGDSCVAIVPLRWHTLSVVAPRRLRDDVIVGSEAWRPRGYRSYLKRMLQGLEDVAFAIRPQAAPYRELHMSLGERYYPPVIDEAYENYRPESVEAWLQRRAEYARFYYGDEDSDASFSSDSESLEGPELQSPALRVPEDPTLSARRVREDHLAQPS